MRQITSRFQTLLEGIAANPTLRERMRLVLDEAAGLSSREKLRYLARGIMQKAKWEIVQLQAAGYFAASEIIVGPPHASRWRSWRKRSFRLRHELR
jgi:hypothetical protein